MSPRRKLLAAITVGVVTLAVSSCGSSSEESAPSPTKPLSSLGPLEPAPPAGRLGGELAPIPAAPPLAPADSKATVDESVDGIKCERNAELIFHVHVHLTLFANGEQRRVPAGIGIYPPLGPQNFRGNQFGVTHENCITWLSTRYGDGLIHVESSVQRGFELGDFFDVWGQPLGPGELGPEKGEVTAIVNGRVWTDDPRKIPLTSHAQIQLMVGRPLVAPQTIEFPGAF